MKNPTSLQETLNEKTPWWRKDTLRCEQYPPMAASRANPTFSSSSRNVHRAKETTIMKWPVSTVGCTDLLKVRWISDANFIPGEKSNPKESAAWTAMRKKTTRRERERRRNDEPIRWQNPRRDVGIAGDVGWLGLGWRWRGGSRHRNALLPTSE